MKHILISRTDKIGDVVLTLPMAGIIKQHYPDAYIYFLGNTYTESIIKKSRFVDEFLNWDQLKGSGKLPKVDYFIHVFPDREIARLAKAKKVKHRIGTSHRVYHWWTCNERVHFTRKKSDLHEAQLNTRLLAPLGISAAIDLKDMHQYLGWQKMRDVTGQELLTRKFNLIFHTKSRGSAKEWRLENYLETIEGLPADQFQIFLSGTEEEGKLIRQELPRIFERENVTDITGRFSLTEFISFIEQCDGLLACSTGPLHIASAAGIKCLGLYPAARPIHAGRWAPIGVRSRFISEETPSDSHYLNIPVSKVRDALLGFVD